MYRKTPALLLSSVAALAMTVGCGGDDAPATDTSEAGEVTLMMYAGVVQDNYTKAVVEPFMKKYPDIKVTYQPMESSADGLATLRSEKGDPSIDVAVLDISIAATGNKEQILQPLDPNAVPNMADIAEPGKVADNFGPALTFDNLVLLHNTDAVSTAPKSWNALFDPAVKGKIAIDAAPDIQGISLMLILNSIANADYRQTVDPAVARLGELAPAVETWAPNPDPYTMVTNGGAAMAIGWNARAQFYSDDSGGKLGVTLPDEGSVFQINTINLVKGSDSPKAAQTFINYALGPEAQAAFAETMYYAPTNSKTKVAEDLAARTASTPERREKMLDVDWSFVAGKNEQWTEIWRREIVRK